MVRGLVMRFHARYAEALVAYQNAADRFTRGAASNRSTDADVARCDVLRRLGRREEAMSLAIDALNRASESGYAIGRARTLNTLGVLYYVSGDQTNALAYYTESRDEWEKIGNDSELARAIHNIALVKNGLGLTDEARGLYERCIGIFERSGRVHEAAVASANLGALFEASGHLDEARSHYARAVKLGERTGDRVGTARTLIRLSQLEQSAGESDVADVYRQRARNLAATSRRDAERVAIEAAIEEMEE
jgi:tetratricopeptide (TPR) repeat protein